MITPPPFTRKTHLETTAQGRNHVEVLEDGGCGAAGRGHQHLRSRRERDINHHPIFLHEKRKISHSLTVYSVRTSRAFNTPTSLLGNVPRVSCQVSKGHKRARSLCLAPKPSAVANQAVGRRRGETIEEGRSGRGLVVESASFFTISPLSRQRLECRAVLCLPKSTRGPCHGGVVIASSRPPFSGGFPA